MALSESKIPPDAQHYLVCGSKDCEKNCQFYCNDCHQPMCEQCRDEHQKNKKTKIHEVASYRERKRQIPVEKCKIHPTKEIDLLCEVCRIPICSKCTGAKEHRGHVFTDLEMVFNEKVTLFHKEIAKIQDYLNPTSQDLKTEIARDVTAIKEIMEDIRASMRAEADAVKKVVDAVMSDNIEQVDKTEQSLLQTLNEQGLEIDDYSNYLNSLIKTLYSYLSPSNIQQLSFALKLENLFIRPIPETSKTVPPVFSAGQYSKEDVAKLLGKMTFSITKAKGRKIEFMEKVHSKLKPIREHSYRKHEREKCDVKQTLFQCLSVTKIREWTVLGVQNALHISLDKSFRLWVSDSRGSLVRTDLNRNQYLRIRSSGGCEGYHTITPDGELLYTDRDKNVIKRVTEHNEINEFINTGDLEALSVHYSKINGDILVGLRKVRKGKVIRYNKTGKEIQDIQIDKKRQKLYDIPHYITENMNGNICVSDYGKEAVVVVDKLGQHRFSYTGQMSGFGPYGISTDVLGHILVCDSVSNTIHLLDQDGQFLSQLLTEEQRIEHPRSVCVDNENNLWVGQLTNTVTVYKFTQ
uniref:Tripartite motif-containing protein 3 n=1 Tax=Magallana gigas TaxID=29159 RepID=K1Q8N2_MAGGI